MNITALENNIRYKDKLNFISEFSNRKDFTSDEFEKYNLIIGLLYFNIMKDNFHFENEEPVIARCLIYGFHFKYNNQYINCGFINQKAINKFYLNFNFYFSTEGMIREGFNRFQIEFKNAYEAMIFLINNIQLIKDVSVMLKGKAKIEKLVEYMSNNDFKFIRNRNCDKMHDFMFKPNYSLKKVV